MNTLRAGPPHSFFSQNQQLSPALGGDSRTIPHIPMHMDQSMFMKQSYGPYQVPPSMAGMEAPGHPFPERHILPGSGPSTESYMNSSNVHWANPSVPSNQLMQPAMGPYSFDLNCKPPFIDLTQNYGPANYGVIKIKNIPYSLTISEVYQFVSKQVSATQLLEPHKHGFGVHIIMERSTAKTMDVFVEVQTEQDAYAAMSRHESLLQTTRPPKMGTRNVHVDLSNQGELMRELFPRAKSVVWNSRNGLPEVVVNMDPYSDGFRGFLTVEELAGMLRHAEFPQRSPFSARCLQRTFECMISTLYKYPWFTSLYYTLKDRNRLFETYFKQLCVLLNKAAPESREVGLDNKLLLDFIFAGVNCPGFSERQKSSIVSKSGSFGRGVSNNEFREVWPFETLGKLSPPTVADQDVSMWLNLLHLGLSDCENAGEEVIIDQYVDVGRDMNGNVCLYATDEGLDISWADFTRFEQRMMKRLIEKGWQQYFANLGIPYDPRPFDDDNEAVGNMNQGLEELAISETGPKQYDFGSNQAETVAEEELGHRGFTLPRLMERRNRASTETSESFVARHSSKPTQQHTEPLVSTAPSPATGNDSKKFNPESQPFKPVIGQASNESISKSEQDKTQANKPTSSFSTPSRRGTASTVNVMDTVYTTPARTESRISRSTDRVTTSTPQKPVQGAESDVKVGTDGNGTITPSRRPNLTYATVTEANLAGSPLSQKPNANIKNLISKTDSSRKSYTVSSSEKVGRADSPHGIIGDRVASSPGASPSSRPRARSVINIDQTINEENENEHCDNNNGNISTGRLGFGSCSTATG